MYRYVSDLRMPRSKLNTIVFELLALLHNKVRICRGCVEVCTLKRFLSVTYISAFSGSFLKKHNLPRQNPAGITKSEYVT